VQYTNLPQCSTDENLALWRHQQQSLHDNHVFLFPSEFRPLESEPQRTREREEAQYREYYRVLKHGMKSSQAACKNPREEGKSNTKFKPKGCTAVVAEECKGRRKLMKAQDGSILKREVSRFDRFLFSGVLVLVLIPAGSVLVLVCQIQSCSLHTTSRRSPGGSPLVARVRN